MKTRTIHMITAIAFMLAASVRVSAAGSDSSAAEDINGIFTAEYRQPGVAEAFIAGKDWFPLPEYSDRKGWAEIFAADSAVTVRRGEKYLDYEWQLIPATAYLAFERTGDRYAMERRQGANRGAFISLILAELAEGKGRFIDQIANGAWAASQEISWVLSAHQPSQRSNRSLPDSREHFIDLASGRYGSIMSIAWHFFHKEFDKLDPSISYAAKEAIRRNILIPYLDENERRANHWLGYGNGMMNNWTPWCTSDVILSFLLIEDDQELLDKAIRQSLMSMDRFLDYISEDGACEEGPGYWDAAAGKMYDWLQIMYDASDGRFSVFDNDRIRRMGEYISRSYIGNGYVVNFADADAIRNAPNELVWNYGNAVGSKEMKNFALYCQADRRTGKFRAPAITLNDSWRAMNTLRFNPAMRTQIDSLNALLQTKSLEEILYDLRKDVPASTWYSETEQCFIRNSSQWFLGAKGGFNNESHNHNDVGTFILYIRDIPVFIDAGVGTYTKQTFSKTERYKLWSMQCDWHNLPMINGIAQPFGGQWKASNTLCNLKKGIFSLDIDGAYPEEAGCTDWNRKYILSQSGKPSLKITDSFSLSERTAADIEHFLVKGEVLLPGQDYKGKVIPEGELIIICDGDLAVKMTYSRNLKASVDIREMDDRRFARIWGPVLRRISLTSDENAPIKGKYEFTITEIRNDK